MRGSCISGLKSDPSKRMFSITEHMNTVNIREEQPIVARCVDLLKDYLQCKKVDFRPHQDPDQDYWFDITCETKPRTRFLGMLRKHGRLIGEQIRHIAIDAEGMRKEDRKRILFMAPWITDAWADELRRAGVQYVDVVGNAYLNLEDPQVLVDIRGKRPKTAPKAEPGRLVEPTGLKVIHHLLTRKEAVNEPYRKVALDAGVALGTVATVMRELKAAGYLAATAEDRFALEKTAELLELFVRGYALKLRPACLLGRYRHAEKDPWKLCETLTPTLETRNLPYALTGAWAAHEWTGHLRAETLALYVDGNALGAWKGQPMLPDPTGGNVTLFRYFGPTVKDPDPEENKGHPLATKLLVYAELLHDGRPRELETAKMLYDRFLRP